MKINISNFKIQVFVMIFFLAPTLFSQGTDSLFAKLKEQQNQKLFYQSIFQNPSLMADFGKYKFSTINLRYQNNQKDAYRIQQPKGENFFEVEAQSFFPLKNHQVVWGKAIYNNKNQKNVRWNESIDYELIYPYVTADEIGGNLNEEAYSFLGGFAKEFERCNLGMELDYRAKLSSRSKDPRPKNISSDLNLKLGGFSRNIFGIDFGFYLGFQKYTQSNDIKFFSELGSPPVYHLNGMGYYNNLLKGTKLHSFYEGYGYRFGGEFTNSLKRNIWLTFDFNQLNVEKITIEGNGTEAMRLTNRDLNINLVKLFNNHKNTYGIKLNYLRNEKKGLEPILSGRGNNNNIEVISRNENYRLENDFFELSGLFYSEKKGQLNFSPFVNYQIYREEYFLVKSFQYFDYMGFGVKVGYINALDVKNILSFGLNINHRKNLKKTSLLRNDDEVSLSEMMLHNYQFLASNFTKYAASLKIDRYLSPKFNIFLGISSEIVTFGGKTNYLYNISTGVSF
ncbi:MAG: hypothetical protein Q4A09_04440 [Capnocytophaga felis]|nr:hypothetical protein [Capnocytophaga felis]